MEWRTVDKGDWGAGPWQDEPDKIHWVDEATDLDCLIVRNPHGSLCGYVGLPPGHRYHGAPYEDVPVDVHGDLTYADSCWENVPESEGVCHVPLPGRPADVWWLGFDCGHAFDLSPGLQARLRTLEKLAPDVPPLPFSLPDLEEYRTVEYVRGECERLAAQLR